MDVNQLITEGKGKMQLWEGLLKDNLVRIK